MAFAVLKKRPDGTSGLLNIFEQHDQNAERDANRAAASWRTYMPTEHVYVKQVKRLDKCQAVNNTDGFVDKVRD